MFECLLFLLAAAPRAQTFDLIGGMMLILPDGKEHKKDVCLPECTCGMSVTEEVLQTYIKLQLPSMGIHMRKDYAKEIHNSINLLTSWSGSMADIECDLPENTTTSLSDILAFSSLSFKSLSVTCDDRAKLIWDISFATFYVKILKIQNCDIDPPARILEVPINLWVLHLDHITAEFAQMLDMSLASHLIALTVSNTPMSNPPSNWSTSSLPRLVYVSLTHNNLKTYNCEIQSMHVATLNLDHNLLTSVPDCLLDGHVRTHFLSLRDNRIENLVLNTSHNTSADMSVLAKLSYLDVSYNKIKTVCELQKLNHLTGLDLSHNTIQDIDIDAFLHNIRLTWLDLSFNLLENLPADVFNSLHFLEYLNISHNRLRIFNFNQSPISTAIALDLTYNMLSYPPFVDKGYTASQHLHISSAYNPFVCDCNLLPFVNFIHIINSSSQNQNWILPNSWSWHFGSTLVQPYNDLLQFKCIRPANLRGSRLVDLPFKHSCPLLRDCPSPCKCYLDKSENETVYVDCSSATEMTELPLKLPLISSVPVVLLINGSNIKKIEHRHYLNLLRELHAGGAKVNSMSSAAIQALQNVSVLDLHDNYLRSMPAATQNITLMQASNITLTGNPWSCGCHDLWMPAWLSRHGEALWAPNSVRCRWNDLPVTELTENNLHCGFINILPLLIVLVVLVGFLAVTFTLLMRYKMEVLAFIYTRFRVRPFDMFRYEPKRTHFDVFVSFAHQDYHWVVEKLVDQLENRPKPYKLCIFGRDFPPGKSIADSIVWAADNSLCTLMILTRDFLANEWCRHELRAAHVHLIKDHKIKLMCVVHGLLDARSLDRTLRSYLRTHTYLNTEDDWFWFKLEYVLPQPQQLLAPPGPAMMIEEAIADHFVDEARHSSVDPRLASGDVISAARVN